MKPILDDVLRDIEDAKKHLADNLKNFGEDALRDLADACIREGVQQAIYAVEEIDTSEMENGLECQSAVLEKLELLHD